jgi:hypothetical protein
MAFIPDEAVDGMTKLSAGAWRLYCFLARCRNQKSGKCCPSVRVTAEAIDVHPKNIFKLRNELTQAGWAQFDGDNATGLLGFNGSKNATIPAPESSKNTTIESQKHYPPVAKTLPNGSKNATPYKEEPAKEPAKRTNVGATAPDSRTQHAAIQTCRGVASRYPPKELWDKLIQVLGETPNTTLLVECRTEWVERGYNRASWKWATEWYATGVPARIIASPPKQNKAAYVGAIKPARERQVNTEDLAFMNEYVDGLIAKDDFERLADEYDEIIKRGGAKVEWEIRCVTWYELHKNEPATPEQMAELNASINALVKR